MVGTCEVPELALVPRRDTHLESAALGVFEEKNLNILMMQGQLLRLPTQPHPPTPGLGSWLGSVKVDLVASEYFNSLLKHTYGHRSEESRFG